MRSNPSLICRVKGEQRDGADEELSVVCRRLRSLTEMGRQERSKD